MSGGRTGFAFSVPLAALAASVTLGGCGSGGGGASPDGSAETNNSNGKLVCAWQPDIKELSTTQPEVKGVLKGISRNSSTTCTRQKGTGGPEVVYGLRLKERVVVDLEVVSNLDTVIAVRKACDEPLTEVACGDDPLEDVGNSAVDAGVGVPFPVGVDAAAFAASAPGRDGHVRTAMDPGLYYVVIDEAEPFGVGGEFTLRVSVTAPPAETSCQTAVPIMDGTLLSAERLTLANEKGPACTGAAAQPALFYSAQVPSGQRLTVRALPLSGDHAWTPVLQLISACREGACLATDRASEQGDRVLRYVNNGPATQNVLLSVSASVPVNGPIFRLSAAIGQPGTNLTCQTALPVTDGVPVRGQDLSEAVRSTNPGCFGDGTTSLFYKATVLGGQSLQVSVVSPTQQTMPPPLIQLHRGCNDTDCMQSMGSNAFYQNPGSEPETIIIEVGTFKGGPPFVFDLVVSLPLPAGAIGVSPLDGLITTESGGSATFDVVLKSPPRIGEVTIPLESGEPKEGKVSPASLTFTSSTWNVPQRVTVTGVDDELKDGARPYKVLLKPAVSVDARYSGLRGPDVSLINRDNEPGVTVTGQLPLFTSESGKTATVNVALNRAPTAAVHFALTSSDVGEGTVSPAELTFDAGNWSNAQTVTLTGVDDTEKDGLQAYKLLLAAATSSDPQYAGLDPDDLDARNADDDFTSVAAQTVIDGATCVLAGVPRIAADQGGGIFVAAPCYMNGRMTPTPGGSMAPIFDAGVTDAAAFPADLPPTRDLGFVGARVMVVASVDGGLRYGPVVDTGIPVIELGLVALSPRLLVLAGLGPQGLVTARSEDGGGTWQAVRMLDSAVGMGGVVVAGAGNRVVLATQNGGRVWASDDGGASFRTGASLGISQPLALHVDAASGDVWLAEVQQMTGRATLSKSTDGGQSFATSTPIDGAGLGLVGNGFQNLVAFTATEFFAAGKNPMLTVRPLASPLQTRMVSGVMDLAFLQRSLVPDVGGNVTLLEITAGAVSLRRLPAGASSFGVARTGAPSDSVTQGAAISSNAVAVLTMRSSSLQVSVEVWP